MSQQLGAAPDPADEHAGGHRVERAGVPDLAGAQDPPQPRHDVVGGEPGGLVDDHETGQLQVILNRHARILPEAGDQARTAPVTAQRPERTRSSTATRRMTTNAVSPVQTPTSPQPNTSDAQVSGRNPAAAATSVQVRR